MKPNVAQAVLDHLNHTPRPNEAAIKEFHASLAVRNLHQGKFTTRDGIGYSVNKDGEIRHDRPRFMKLTKKQRRLLRNQ